jgi:hypothetical protein
MSEYEETHGTYDGYYDQYKNTAKEINVGDKFVTFPGSWEEATHEVIYTDDTVALCVETKGLRVGSKCLYYNKGEHIGWKYNDSRGAYRLQTIKNPPKA